MSNFPGIELREDEAAFLAEDIRCKCEHLSVFHHSNLWGERDFCIIEGCDCSL